MQFTAPADLAPRTLRVYCGAKTATLNIDLALSDGSASAFTDMQVVGTPMHFVYKATYRAASTGQMLTVTLTDTSDTATGAFVMLASATLQ
jgi:hypothetical protein